MSVVKAKQGDELIEVTDARKHPFYVIDNDLIAVYGPKIGVYGVAVYNVLAYYSDKKEMAWPSYQTIADHLDMSRPKVVSTIDGLISCGLVRKEHRYSASGDMTSNNYILVSIHGEGSKQDLPPSKPHELPSKQDLPQGSKPQSIRSKRRIQEQDPMNNTHLLEQEEKAAAARARVDEPETAAAAIALPSWLVTLWNGNMDGKITPLLEKALRQTVTAYPRAEIEEGVSICVARGNRTHGFLLGVLKRGAFSERPPDAGKRAPDGGRYSDADDAARRHSYSQQADAYREGAVS